MEVILAMLLLLVVAAFIAAPLRARPERATAEDRRISERGVRLADLEARKEAKYREIRDTELDRASGKLSDADFERQDAELRRDAVEILEQIDDLREPGGGDGH